MYKYRHAKFSDVEEIYNLIASYASQGIMLPKPHSVLYENIREFVVAENLSDKKIIGTGALHMTWNELAEVRSMAVHENYKRQGIGAEIVKKLLAEGIEFGVKKFFTLTYSPQFFQSLGFTTTTKETLPHKIWKECIECPKFPNCDEIAMTLEVD
ncbi:MAG: N-acetyltransferase [Selenomonadaceae bacterium]|nr:N-acetyltransferase [Selenomonadaceae bacterium]